MSLPPTIACLTPNPTTYGIVEFSIVFHEPIIDPFRRVQIVCRWVGPDGAEFTVYGFCESADGCVHRLRFMPIMVGEFRYEIAVTLEDGQWNSEGTLECLPGDHPGILRAEGEHFRFSEGDYFFWNATTAYMMAGLSDTTIRRALDRLSGHGINRIRLSICPSRQPDGRRWYEAQVAPREDFTYAYGPWRNACPDDILHPQWDLNRFDVDYWQKFDRLVAYAGELGIQVQIVFYTDAQEDQNYPFDRAAKEDIPEEILYYQYAVARLAAYANVEWCVTNEWAVFRPDEWANRMGKLLAQIDPYHHLLSVHGHGHFPFASESWPTHALFQVWDEDGGYDWVLRQRAELAAIGRTKPIINEEYGYEDHYPGPWGGGRVAPARNADSRRRLAWEITMAGGHQTTGESAANGLGGWINGLGDDSMQMLPGYRNIKTFFESIPWWKLAPRPDLVTAPLRCLASEGQHYVIYAPATDSEIPEIAPADWNLRLYNPRTGTFEPEVNSDGDWVYLWTSTNTP
jgi:Protein of unknown function (DUF4038)/Domain of unknown function (DUF5060)